MPTDVTNQASTDADVLVIFGITGDLARVMTFRSLYRLEQRGLLACPIVGVAHRAWTREQLVAHARESIIDTGETLDETVFERFAARLSYIHGDFADARLYEQLAAAVSEAACPVSYLEIPPSLFATVVKGLAGAGLTTNGRVVVEKPFGFDLASARSLAAELYTYVDESQLYRIDHYLGKMGLEEILYYASPTRCWSRCGTATTSTMSRSPWSRTSGSRPVAASTILSGRCETSSSTTSCSSSRSSRRRRRREATQRR